MNKLRLPLFLCAFAAFAAQPVQQNLFDQLQWRFIGPFRGGRVVSVSGVLGDAATFYFGSVGGGVWKTTDGGTMWQPIFDQQPIASIGAIAVAPSAPEIIYVGTGEADIRSQIGFGNGVYKSTDAGKTWTNVGLRDTRQISKILVDPFNPNIVYVAALGHAYGPNLDRGVFRSTDGGRTWKKVLYTRPDVGAADITLEVANPTILWATMWNARRPVWSQYPPIEGPGGGLWKSVDGGEHWTQISGRGLPQGMWHRSGVAVATGGKRVYVLVDALAGGGLYRSDDGGETWLHASSDPRITSRAWYFSGITVDPQKSDVVYIPNVALYRSTDGGISFTVLKGAPGGDDYHTLWIDRSDTRRMVLGSDQGTNISMDGGKSWSTWYNQPTAQMYHVITDNRFPYAVYGSQQDSGTAAVLSRTDHSEIDARDWFSVGGAESGYIAIDPKNQNTFYVGDTNGSLVRFDRRTGQSQNVTPWPVRSFAANISTLKYRYPWTAPLVFSQSETNTLYFGSQYVMKTIDGGITWKEISPDLTGDTRKEKRVPDIAVTTENARELGYGVVYSIAPSPLRPGLIWAGSDTGLIHVTQNGGETWQNVTPKELTSWSKIAQIEASHFDASSAYAAVDRHRLEDYKPYIYRTHDYGKTWTLIANGLAEPAYVNCVREDPARRGLLYASTELGVAVSFDDGDHWQSLQLNLPAVSVRDMAVHGDDLVIATHGRGFWILDNASPLRQADEKVAASDAFLFKPAAAIRMNPESFFGTPFPVEEPKAKNPPDGAILDYYFKSAPEGEVTLEILDAKGQVVRGFSTKLTAPPPQRRPGAIADVWLSEPPPFAAKAGMNRFVWDLRYAAPGPESSTENEFDRAAQGPQVLPGAYQVRLKAGGRMLTQPLIVKLDPRSTATQLELAKQLELSLTCSRAIAKTNAALHDVRAVQLELANRRVRAGAEAALKIAELQYDTDRIGGPLDGGGRGSAAPSAGPTLSGIASQLSAALSVAESADRTPPAAAYTLYEQANRELTAQLAVWKRFREIDLPELNRLLEKSKLPVIEFK
jgi:photosystem II stability/assembly factor-like uncharacterized protein